MTTGRRAEATRYRDKKAGLLGRRLGGGAPVAPPVRGQRTPLSLRTVLSGCDQVPGTFVPEYGRRRWKSRLQRTIVDLRRRVRHEGPPGFPVGVGANRGTTMGLKTRGRIMPLYIR